MEFVQTAVFVQIAGFFSVFLYLAAALYQVRIQREMYELMNTEINLPESEQEDLRVYSHSHRSHESMAFATEWENMSWEEKMHYLRLDQRLNWLAAGNGTVALLCGVVWTHIEINLGGAAGLGRQWLGIFGFLIAFGVLLLFRGYYRQWAAARDDYVSLQHRRREKRSG